jgi:hypothetical protein
MADISTMASPPRSTGRLLAFITLCVLTVVGWAPLLGVLASSLFASSFGCTLNEGNLHPCVVAGIDFGGLLYTGFVGGWLMLVTWPFMLLTLVIWIVLGIAFIVRRVRAKPSSSN